VVVRVLRWIAIAVIGFVALLLVVSIVARYSDGPIAIFAGGPLVAGELSTGPEPDWSFAREIGTIELQLLEPPRSRTTWVVEREGKLYVPCGYMNSGVGRMWKKWPVEAEADGRAIVRIEGRRYERRLVRVKDPAVFAELAVELKRKYQVSDFRATVDDGGLWLFELAPRES